MTNIKCWTLHTSQCTVHRSLHITQCHWLPCTAKRESCSCDHGIRELTDNIPEWAYYPQLGIWNPQLCIIYSIGGTNLVFAMTIKLIPEFWKNQASPKKFWKTHRQVKLDLFLMLFLIPEFAIPSQDQPPYNLSWHIMFRKPKWNICFKFLLFC